MKSTLEAIYIFSSILIFSFFLSACHPRIPPPIISNKRIPEQHFATTVDGWKLSLNRYPSFFRKTDNIQAFNNTNSDDTRKRPVILCHGLSTNRYSFDLTEVTSLAKYLADLGFDIWLLELRGHGNSVRVPKSEEKNYKIEKNYDGWSFDDYVQKDLPAAISYVKERTNSDGVYWIGHSMGTMVMYAYQSINKDPSVEGVVAIASPGSLEFANDMVRLSLKATKYISILPRLNGRLYSRLWSRVSGHIPFGFSEAVWQEDNMSKEHSRLTFYLAVDTIERGEQQSFVKIMKEGKLISRDSKFDYMSNMHNFASPILEIAGNLDALAPPFSIQRLFDKIKSTDKTLEILSRSNGYKDDYGHVDLLLGNNSKEDLYPLVYKWLNVRNK